MTRDRLSQDDDESSSSQSSTSSLQIQHTCTCHGELRESVGRRTIISRTVHLSSHDTQTHSLFHTISSSSRSEI
eukprot:750086-Hanusia_phi.AAC.1